ncbi:MAG: chemotaxis protein CheC [Bacteroidia bacterium]
MDTEDEVSALEVDILKEIINIGLAKVADSFAMMAKEPVMLHVPKIEILNLEALNNALPENESTDYVIESDIKGDLNAKSLLIFKQAQATKLSTLCLGPEKDFKGNYNAMKQSLLLETSNILTGALITQFANIFHMNLVGMPPVAVPYRLRRTFADLIVGNLVLNKPIVLTVKTHFLNTGKEVELPMIVVLDISSMYKIISIIRESNKLDTNWLAHHN